MKKIALKLISFFSAIILFSQNSFSQNEANIWYFGQNAGLNFNTGSPPSTLLDGQLYTEEGAAVISDAAGHLLFYTDGVKVWNKLHNVMPNGTGLLGHSSSTQSAIITPYVGDPHKYYIFTTDGITCPPGDFKGLFYSVVDMNLNGGLGDIVPGRKNISMVNYTREQVTAAKHANGIDYWIITRKHETNQYYAFLVTCNGIDVANPVITAIGSTFVGDLFASPPTNSNVGVNTNTGYLKTSPDSKALISAFNYAYNELYDFNNATGQLSNAHILSNDLGTHYGASFSPDGSLIYMGGKINGSPCIMRYQRNAPDVSATEVIENFPASLGFIHALQLAPDGKIYFTYSDQSLGVIFDPNNYSSPDFRVNYVSLSGRWSQYGLPNYFDALFFGTPDPIAGRDTTVCFNMPVQLGDAPKPGLNYTWSPSSGLDNSFHPNPIASVSVTTIYTVIAFNSCDTIFDTVSVSVYNRTFATVTPNASDACGAICQGSATVTATGSMAPYVYLWSNMLTTQVVTGLCEGTYTVIIIDNARCAVTYTVAIALPVLLHTASVTAYTNVSCFGGNNGTATAGTPGSTGSYTYGWNTVPVQTAPTATGLQAGTYTVTITDANGCSAKAFITITEPVPLIITPPANNSICRDNSITLNAIAAGGNGNYSFSWNPGNISGNPINVSPTVTTTFTVIATDVNGCISLPQIVTLTVYPLPVASFTPLNASGCVPLCVDFVNTTPGTASCSWSFGDGYSGNTDNFKHCYTLPGIYSVSFTVTDSNGCINSVVQDNMVEVFPMPTAGFTTNLPVATLLDPLIVFTDISSDASNWQWSFGDVLNSSSSDQHTQFAYSDTGSFSVQLIVTNNYGCADTVAQTITVQEEYTIYTPNTFTPNGDGLNDVFLPEIAANVQEYDLYIFDRWGNLIFKSDVLYKGWDGKANRGNDLIQIDTYIWKLDIKDNLNMKHRYIGHINLIK